MSVRRHFGSVRKLPSGKYQASYWHYGRRHTAAYTFDRKADAEAWLSTTETSILKGAWVDPTAGKVTLAAYAAGWIAKRSDLRPTTRAKYETLLRLHVSLTLGDVELAKVAPSSVRTWYTLSRNGIRPRRTTPTGSSGPS